jgi:hypothetical protein
MTGVRAVMNKRANHCAKQRHDQEHGEKIVVRFGHLFNSIQVI